MNKHTKGPWAIETNHVVAGSVRVAVVDTPNLHAGVDWVEADANVRLIANAPTLLQALKGLEWACNGVEYMEDEYVVQLAIARAAIAAATEGQP
jgi:hypothetical protein